MNEQRISTGIDGLDRAIDHLRPGDTVIWQCEHIGDYMYVADAIRDERRAQRAQDSLHPLRRP